MVHWIKCFAHKPGDLSMRPRAHGKRRNMQLMPVIPGGDRQIPGFSGQPNFPW